MQDLRLESLADFECEVAKLEEYLESKRPHLIPTSQPLFRGHGDASWKLETTIERYRPGVNTSVEAYNRFLERILPAVSTYTDRTWKLEGEFKLPQDFFDAPPNYEFIVYCRHHGFPSPLLDWTASQYIALYFAYRDSTETDVAVFAYVSAPEGAKREWAGAPTINELGPYFTTHRRHFMQQSRYTFCAQKPDAKWEYCSHESAFNPNDDSQYLLRKYTLPARLRPAVLAVLDRMNINDYTLFSSEDSLMRMLANREILLREI